MIDAVISLKDRLLVEMLRGAILWTILLKRNRICFYDSNPLPIKSIATEIT